MFAIQPRVVVSSCNHQTIIITGDAVFEQDGAGVRVVLSPGFGYSVVLALDCAALEKIIQAWPVPDVCDELPF